MQLGNVVNDLSQSIDCGNGTLKLSTNHDDFNKNPERSFKEVLSDNDIDGYETDVSLGDEVRDICFDLSNDFVQTDGLMKQDMSLIDILFINTNVDYQKTYDEIEYDCSENTLEDIANSNYEGLCNGNNIEKDLQNFQEILGNNDNKKNILKNKIISNTDSSDSEFQDNVESLKFNSINVINDKDVDNKDKEQLEDFTNIEKQITLDVKIKSNFNDEFKQGVDKKYNEDENMVKSNSSLNNFDQVGNSSKKHFEKGDKKIFDLEINNKKESTRNAVDINVLKSEESIKFSDNPEPILGGKSIESRVINDTKNALAECIRSKDGEFNLYLEPKSLGVLKIKVSFKENNTISVIFNATNPQAIDILRKETSDIVNMISSLGFDVNSESLNFNFSQQHSNSSFSRNQSFRPDGDKSVGYSENLGMYKKIWILNDQNIDVLV